MAPERASTCSASCPIGPPPQIATRSPTRTRCLVCDAHRDRRRLQQAPVQQRHLIRELLHLRLVPGEGLGHARSVVLLDVLAELLAAGQARAAGAAEAQEVAQTRSPTRSPLRVARSPRASTTPEISWPSGMGTSVPKKPSGGGAGRSRRSPRTRRGCARPPARAPARAGRRWGRSCPANPDSPGSQTADLGDGDGLPSARLLRLDCTAQCVDRVDEAVAVLVALVLVVAEAWCSTCGMPSCSKEFRLTPLSVTTSEIRVARPPYVRWSSSTTKRPSVSEAERMTSSASMGLRVHMSTTRTLTPSFASSSAASSACATVVPWVKRVTSLPSRATMPLPIRMSCSPGA